MKPSNHAGWRGLARHRVLDFLIPARCRLCELPSRRDIDLCLPCEGELPWLTRACSHCALPLAVTAPSCAKCLRRPPAFDSCIAACSYTAPVDHWIHAGKYCGDFSALRVLSCLLHRAVAARLEEQAPPDLLIPMPLHWWRRWRRGLNQAEEIARPLARSFQLPIDPRIARRRRATAPQQSLDARSRRKNLEGAFTVPGRLDGRSVAIIDDVLTTGASAEALATALKAAGAAHVSVWCCARTPHPAAVQ